MTLPQNYIHVWSGNLKDLPDPIDLAKTQIKLSFELKCGAWSTFSKKFYK
jgi:hypothetical protein